MRRSRGASVSLTLGGFDAQIHNGCVRDDTRNYTQYGICGSRSGFRGHRSTLRAWVISMRDTVLKPPAANPNSLCTGAFGVTGVCILAKKVNMMTGAVLQPVRGDTVTGMYVTGFPANGVFGYGTNGLVVTNVSAVNDGEYGLSRFESTRTFFAGDTAVGNHEAGFYVGDSPDADTVVRDNVAVGNQFGIFIRHAREVTVFRNVATRNCQGILVLDDGQKGG